MNKYDINESFKTSGSIQSNSSGLNDTFNCFESKGLHFIHFNIRSLFPKLAELKTFISKYKFAVIALSETWLDSSVTDSEVHLDGFSIVRRDRDRQGGGVCLYISNDLAFTERKDLDTDKLEAVWVNLLLPKSKPILIGSCYRPRRQSVFTELLEYVLNSVRSDTEWFILGDFNICYFDKCSTLYKIIFTFFRYF